MKVCALWGVVIVDESESKLGDERPPNLEFTLAGRSLRVRVGGSSEGDGGSDGDGERGGEGEGWAMRACGRRQMVMATVRVKATAAVRKRVGVISEDEGV